MCILLIHKWCMLIHIGVFAGREKCRARQTSSKETPYTLPPLQSTQARLHNPKPDTLNHDPGPLNPQGQHPSSLISEDRPREVRVTPPWVISKP